ncbi:MAG: hypothetical protein RDU89_03740 [bacterium]|nr:hypothetical protein [bacterium]
MAGSVPPAGDELTPERRDEIIDWIVERAARGGLITPAMLLIEAHRPLSFIGSQAVHFFSPVIGAIVDPRRVDELALLMENRDNIDLLVDRLQERLDQDQARRPPRPRQTRGWRGFLARLLGSSSRDPGGDPPTPPAP